jgi:hypothetical protein
VGFCEHGNEPWGYIKAGNFSTTWKSCWFSRTVLHGICYISLRQSAKNMHCYFSLLTPSCTHLITAAVNVGAEFIQSAVAREFFLRDWRGTLPHGDQQKDSCMLLRIHSYAFLFLNSWPRQYLFFFLCCRDPRIWNGYNTSSLTGLLHPVSTSSWNGADV